MDRLSDAFANKCAYCERRLESSVDRELDLFRPNQAARHLNGTPDMDHYWWLNWEWSNMYHLACQACNWAKGSSFPIASARAQPGCRGDALGAETRLLLDPCADTPETHLQFLETGEVIPLDESEMGLASIEIFDLNRNELVQARRQQAQELMRLLEGARGHDRVALREKECSTDKAFSGMRKQIANRYRTDDPAAKSSCIDKITRILPATAKAMNKTRIKQDEDQISVSLDALRRIANDVLDGRWLVDSLIGEGGMGKIYLARDLRLKQRKVVVKIPDAELLKLSEVRERFEMEVDILIERPHPGIVKVEDRGEINGIPFVVLQYLAGGSLEDLTRKGETKMPISKVLEWLFPIAKALDFLHDQKIFHRDVKPSNILFDEIGNAFLADFGIAKVVGSRDPNLTQTVSFPGTLNYMAPDSVPTPAYDQYSLAVVAFEALTGMLPWKLKRQLHQQTSGLGNILNSSIENVLVSALNWEPESRFKSCTVFAQALKLAAAGKLNLRQLQ